MNIKKLISVSFCTLGIVSALSACSGDKVAGADEQTNTMATQSCSSVGSSSSMGYKSTELDNVAKMAYMEMKELFEESDNIPMYVLISEPAGMGPQTLKDSVDAQASFDEFIQSIASNDSVMWLDPLLNQFSCDSGNCSYYKVALVDENNKTHGPLGFEVTGIYNSIRCNLVDDLTYERKVPFAYDLIFDDGYVFKYIYKDVADYAEDIPSLEQFKNDCEAENGIYNDGSLDTDKESWFMMSDSSAKCTITFADRNDPKWKKYTTDCRNSETGHCERVAPPEDSLIVYKDPNWKKYVMALVNNCVDEVEH